MPRILFVKTSSLGDVVQNCPAVSDAARRVPGAQIDWVVEESFAGVAAMHSGVRQVIPVGLRRWRSELYSPGVWREMLDFRRSLAAERYDIVIDTQSLLKSAVVCAVAKGTKHGMDASSAREPLAARFYNVTHAVPRRLHAVERNRRLTAASLGFALDEDVQYGLSATGSSPLEQSSRYAVFLTMTSRKDKLWPEERWKELGRALDLSVVLPWGNDAERSRAGRIRTGIPKAIVPRRMTVEELGKLFVHARGVIGLDSGLTHLAAALGVPTVGIYCGSDPLMNGLYGAPRAKNVGAPGRPPEAFEVLKQFA
ncbi:MAG TPA: lipopolysaccharide heptosyltransferase I [Burkholderiales bacterium]|nr:lipopolysaccharide heptosyltransferase I [Burkholderiales bacterium]